MTNPTLAQIKTKVKEPLDLEEETFIEDSELTGFVNQAVDEAEATVHNICEDYFETDECLELQDGESEYDLPSDIYANKIRCIRYDDGPTKYEIERYRGKLADLSLVDDNDNYRYRLINPVGGYKLKLLPESRESSTDNVTITFLRNATTLVAETDECDIPEALNFIVAKTQGLCLAKENGGTIPADKQVDIDREKALLVESLSGRIPDENTGIQMDTDVYESHS